MTIFEEFIFTYFISSAALAGFAVLWRNWLEDHLGWKEWLRDHLGLFAKTLTCGSCFTFWVTLIFVLIFDPLYTALSLTVPFMQLSWLGSYFLQWMALSWGALFLRFSYIAIQEATGIMVHRFKNHDHSVEGKQL